jgi:sortase (surface protein transpeptidase)
MHFAKVVSCAIASTILVSPSVNAALIFPEQNQSREQQSLDIKECNEQAREESKFEPAKPVSEEEQQSQEAMQQRQQSIQAYNQILTACLQQRGYTVR